MFKASKYKKRHEIIRDVSCYIKCLLAHGTYDNPHASSAEIMKMIIDITGTAMKVFGISGGFLNA